MKYAPIILFAYNRLEPLKMCLAALKKNYLVEESEIYIFCDFWKDENDRDGVTKVREFLKLVTGFKKVTLNFSETNQGLAKSVISGVNQIVLKYGRVIVIEDDLITSRNFLIFMNHCLLFYENNNRVFSISGYTPNCVKVENDDVYFTKRASSWGWATWSDRWIAVDWEVRDFKNFAGNWKKQIAFNRMGSDLSYMLRRQMSAKINSWAIRWVYFQFKTDTYTVYPTVSKVQNIGTSSLATHTMDRFGRFSTTLDSRNFTTFELPSEAKLNSHYVTQFVKQFSILTRLRYKILNKFF